MKVRKNFVSNSSSTSFVVSLADLSEKARAQVVNLPNRNDEHGRLTGVITDIEEWLNSFDEDWGPAEEGAIRKAIEDKDDAVIVRESDEQMGGVLPEGLFEELERRALLEFEYH